MLSRPTPILSRGARCSGFHIDLDNQMLKVLKYTEGKTRQTENEKAGMITGQCRHCTEV